MTHDTLIRLKRTASTIAVVALIAATGGLVIEAFDVDPVFAGQGDGNGGKGVGAAGGGKGQAGGLRQGGSGAFETLEDDGGDDGPPADKGPGMSGGKPDGVGGGNSPDGSGAGNDKPGNYAGAELTDIGRMNVLKSPDKILYHSLYEVDKATTEDDLVWYTYTADYVATQLIANPANLDNLLDSPTVNMALLDTFWSDGVIDYVYKVPGDEGGDEPAAGMLISTDVSFTDFSAIVIGVAIGKDEIKLYAEDETGAPVYDTSGDLVLADDALDIINTLATIVWGQNTSAWDIEYDALAIAEAAAFVQLGVITAHDAQ